MEGMLLLSVMASAGILLPPQELEIRQRVIVGPAGDRLVEEHRAGGGWVLGRELSGGTRAVTAPRWQEDDNGLAWIGESVRVGDSGAGVMAAKGLNNEAVTLYHAIDSQPVFDHSTVGSEAPEIALADRAPLAAALVVTDMDPGAGYDFEGVLQVWDTTGGGALLWSYTFPRTANNYGGGVAISDDGSVVLAWKGDPNSGTCLVETFDGAGAPVASGALSSGASHHARQVRLSDDGRRAYLNIGPDAVLYDTLGGVEEYRHNIGASFDAHDLSGDGKRFAYGQFGYFRVYEETAPGVWSQAVHRSFSGSVYVGQVALDGDGSHCAFLKQRYSPATDHIEVGVHDVEADLPLFSESWDAPGTAFQLSGRGAVMDDEGEYAAFCSWGDSLNATPEGMVYEVAAAALSCSLDSPGSAYHIDLGPDGDVLAMGTKAVHANTFGNGGSIFVADAFEQLFHVTGWPQAGGTVTLHAPDSWGSVVFGAGTQLTRQPTFYGLLEVLRSSVVWNSPVTVIPSGGLALPAAVPNLPSVSGQLFHLQALVINVIGNELTNKVSLRIQP